MSKTKQPPLSDWHVSIAGVPDVTVRATRLNLRDGSYVLEDVYGNPLFAAPIGEVRYARRLEPGMDVPAAKEEPKAVEAPKPIERIELEPKQARPSRRPAK
jgi:hypothetical protein